MTAEKKDTEAKVPTSELIATPTASLGAASDSKQPPADSEKPVPGPFFSIQVCTYHTEAEARKLIEELKAQNLPAFYDNPPSNTRLHVVMLGKDSSYNAAQRRLEQFKKTEIFKKFSDSYIRRMS